MVTEAQHNEILGECKKWYGELVSFRSKVNDFKTELYYFAPGKTDKDVLSDIERFHNQFHIQLINIHDLKHEIKHHVNEAERHPNFGHRIPHHHIKEKYDVLMSDLGSLEQSFRSFVSE